MTKPRFSGYLMAALCFVFIFLHMGALNTLGVFMPVIVRENGFTTTQVSLLFSFAGVGAVLTGLFLTPLALKKMGPKVCMLISTVLTAVHLLWYGLAQSLIAYSISAVLAGIAIGIGLYAATGAIMGNWFVKNRMTVLGVISAGSGLGSAAFNAASGSAILAFGYRNTYFILAGAVLVLGLLIQLLLRSHPSELGQTALGADLSPLPAAAPAASKEPPDMTLRTLLKTPAFYLIFIGGICGSIAWTGVNMYVVTLLTADYGMAIDVASRYDAVLRVCVAVALVFSGKIAERIGVKAYIIGVGLVFGAGVLITIITGSAIVATPVLLIAVLLLLSVGGSHSSANGQILANSIFGPRNFAMIQSYLIGGLNIGLASSAVISAPFVGSDGSVLGCFSLYLICSCVWTALALVAAFIAPYKKSKHTLPSV